MGSERINRVIPSRLLSKASFKHMLEKPSYTKGSAWYGFGLDVSWSKKAWEHSGTLDGATSTLVRDRHGFTWAFLANYWPVDSDYTSLVAYAITKVPSWCPVKVVNVLPAHASTLDRSRLISVKLPYEEYPNHQSELLSQGYYPIWINGYQVKGQNFFNVIWSNQVSRYKAYHSLTETQFREVLHNAKETDYKLTHIDTYLMDGDVRYAAIFEKDDTKSWVVHICLTQDELEKKVGSLKEWGFHITRQSCVVHDNQLQVAALFEKTDVKGSWAKVDLYSEKYQSEFSRHSRYGHLIAYVKAYQDGDSTKFSTIWTDPGPYQYTSEFDMSEYRLLNDFLFTSQKKFWPICISGYEEDGAHKFVAVLIKKVPPKSVR